MAYLLVTDRSRHASGSSLILEKSLDVMAKAVKAREERHHGVSRHAGLPRNLTNPGGPLGEVGEGPVATSSRLAFMAGVYTRRVRT